MESTATPTGARGKLQTFARALAQQPHLNAVRDGVVGSLPLILLGSAFLLLAVPPWPALARMLPTDALKAGSRALAGVVSLYACAATALSLAKRRECDPTASVTTSLAVLILAQHPEPLAAGGLALPLQTLGAAGLFPSFLAAIFATETIGFFARRKWGIQIGGGAPEAVARSFAAMLPSAVCVGLAWALVHLAGFDLIRVLDRLLQPLLRGGDALPALLVPVLIDSSLHLLGVHPTSLLAPLRPLWLAALTENMTAVLAGQAPTHLATQEFFAWFIWQGGSGGTLALAFWLLFAKSRQLRVVGRAALVPALFNINEPILFGVPVVLNGALAAPFLLGPILMTVTTFTAMRLHLVDVPTAEVIWTLPAPLGAWLATRGDWRAVVLQMCNLFMAIALWWPFVRRYDRHLFEREAAAAANPAAASD